jgi:hypothetical protein
MIATLETFRSALSGHAPKNAKNRTGNTHTAGDSAVAAQQFGKNGCDERLIAVRLEFPPDSINLDGSEKRA